MHLRRDIILTGFIVASMVVSACGTTATTAPGTGVGDTVAGVGVLPGVSSGVDPGSGSTVRSTTTLAPEDQVGAVAAGNRVIVIGDSILASTSRRYSNAMCGALVPLGWQVEVDAETSRFIEFGNKVLDQRLQAGWDTAVILLGNNYINDQAKYRVQLEKMVKRLSPAPVVLLTVTEFDPTRREVNDVIYEMLEKYDNVVLVDWATTSVEDQRVLGGDGLHLTDRGRQVLAENVALALGEAPTSPGACLKSVFTDDSGGNVDGSSTTVKGGGKSTSTTSKSSSPTTNPGATETTEGSTATTAATATTAPPAAPPATS